ncbi:MAG: hypothetical protein AAF211_07460 [Myxococcota bacterium]
MSCPHATTTTLLWLYGEADDAHADHVAGCAECQAVAADHADVMSAMADVSHLDLAPEAELAPLRPANRGVWVGFGMGVALAAAVALIVLRAGPSTPEVASDELPVDLSVFAALEDDPLDEQFDVLSQELGDLAANVEAETL